MTGYGKIFIVTARPAREGLHLSRDSHPFLHTVIAVPDGFTTEEFLWKAAGKIWPDETDGGFVRP